MLRDAIADDRTVVYLFFCVVLFSFLSMAQYQTGSRFVAVRILLSLFHRCAGEVGLVGDGDGEVEARSTRSLSRLTLEELELTVDEADGETKASWSARTSSRRTSESEMRGVASWTSRISMNFEDISRILRVLCDGCGRCGGCRHQPGDGSRDLYSVHAEATWRQKGTRERERKTATEIGKQFNTCRKGERQSKKGVGGTKRERYWSMKGWTAVAPITLFGIGYLGSGVDRPGTMDLTALICDTPS